MPPPIPELDCVTQPPLRERSAAAPAADEEEGLPTLSERTAVAKQREGAGEQKGGRHTRCNWTWRKRSGHRDRARDIPGPSYTERLFRGANLFLIVGLP